MNSAHHFSTLVHWYSAVGKFKAMEKSVYTKMFPSEKRSPNPHDSEEEEEDTIPLDKLEEYRQLYTEQFRYKFTYSKQL